MKSGAAVTAMMAAAISAWKTVVSTGMIRIESAGTPLILKLRKMPASRDSTSGLGRLRIVLHVTVKTAMAGIMLSRKSGLMLIITTPIMA